MEKTRRANLLILLVFSLFIFQNSNTYGDNSSLSDIPNIPVQAIYSDLIEISEIYFNRRTNLSMKGETLEVEFKIKNKKNDPQDIYVFVIATYGREDLPESSLEMPVPEQEILKTFVPYPDDIKNFEYQGSKDEGGIKLLQYPKNIKAGVDPDTGKPYRLTDFFFIWSKHLSKYRNNYYFFNHVTIAVYNDKEEPIFRQNYRIKGLRR